MLTAAYVFACICGAAPFRMITTALWLLNRSNAIQVAVALIFC
jgi:hypothetical protein